MARGREAAAARLLVKPLAVVGDAVASPPLGGRVRGGERRQQAQDNW